MIDIDFQLAIASKIVIFNCIYLYQKLKLDVRLNWRKSAIEGFFLHWNFCQEW